MNDNAKSFVKTSTECIVIKNCKTESFLAIIIFSYDGVYEKAKRIGVLKFEISMIKKIEN